MGVLFISWRSRLGFIFFRIQLSIMDYFWDEAYIGGQNDANFGWRYSHTVTMGNFILVPAIVLKTFSVGFLR